MHAIVKILAIGLFVSGCMGIADAQPVPAPSVRCISVQANGDVVFSWITPPDPSGWFVNYSIWSAAQPGGPYSQLTIVGNYSQNSFTDVGAAMSSTSNPKYYFIQTQYDDGSGVVSSPSSDTLSTMILQVTQGGNSAILDWNAMHIPAIPTWEPMYHIWKKQSGTWFEIDSVPLSTLTYTDSVFVCQDSIYYRITLQDSSGCISRSTVTGDLFQDNVAPDMPILDSVSVDTTTGYVFVGWQPSSSGDTQGYIILHNTGSGWVPVDTVWGINNTFFTDTTVLAIWGAITYAVAAFDSCWKGNPASPNTSATGAYHNTMMLTAVADSCNRSVDLNWIAYNGWPQGVNRYVVFASKNDGAWYPVASLDGSRLSYSDNGLAAGSKYCYAIRAYQKNGVGTSTSITACVQISVPNIPSGLYLTSVSVADNGVDITCMVDPAAAISYYDIERAENAMGPWSSIGSVPPTSSNIITYSDNTHIPARNSVYYRVVAYDICANQVAWSNAGRTIHIVANLDDNGLLSTLNWNNYIDWDTMGTGVSYYNIYRRTPGQDYQPMISVNFGNNSYEDDLSGAYDQIGAFCYYVEAVEGVGNPLGFREVSRSNETCVYVRPRIWIPNAFSPNGDHDNELFRPVVAYSDKTTYTLSIFDRWGQLIFTTNDPNLGWDGTVQGREAHDGLYIFLLRVNSADGQTFTRRGHVMLFR